MPRLPLSLLRKAYNESRYLPPLLRATRDLPSARNELRWLKEYVAKVQKLVEQDPSRGAVPSLASLCHEREDGRPLQYILGSQPFGDLEILCRKGVLIPRPETEIYTTRLNNLLIRHRNAFPDSLKILDLCAGTGCIGLGLLSGLYPIYPDVQIRAVDLNPRARDLALRTVKLNQKLGRLPALHSRQFHYILADILDSQNIEAVVGETAGDVIVANPPYISVPAFWRETSRSARNFEPKNALVASPQPPDVEGEATGDVFYSHILRIAAYQDAKIVLMEVDNLEQARRVMKVVKEAEKQHGIAWPNKQIWCDENETKLGHKPVTKAIDLEYQILGSGQGRAVILAKDIQM